MFLNCSPVSAVLRDKTILFIRLLDNINRYLVSTITWGSEEWSNHFTDDFTFTLIVLTHMRQSSTVDMFKG